MTNSGFIYFIGAERGKTIKIGYSVKPHLRIRQIQSGNADDLKVLFQFRAPKDMESTLHATFKPCHQRGEWFVKASAIRRFAKMLHRDHLKRTMKAMGLDALPSDAEAQAQVLEHMGRRSITVAHVVNALAAAFPEHAEALLAA